MEEDAVEIENLGSVYKGPSEKKYWSSSRGKNRHPYPVGYKACRKEGGRTFMMKIEQGENGPLFSVSCGETERSGSSPNAAWEAIMKALSVGNRKSTKTRSNGAEMFGFADPVVQHLLREMQKETDEQKRTPLLEINSNCRGNSHKLTGSSVLHERSRKRVRSEKLAWPTAKKRASTSRKRRTGVSSQETDERKSTEVHAAGEYVPDSEPEFEGPSCQHEEKAGGLEPIAFTEPERKLESSERPSVVPGATDVNQDPGNTISEDDRLLKPFDPSSAEKTHAIQLEESMFESGSLGQEVTRCMLSLLLPSAVPLLEKSSKRTGQEEKVQNEAVPPHLDFDRNPAPAEILTAGNVMEGASEKKQILSFSRQYEVTSRKAQSISDLGQRVGLDEAQNESSKPGDAKDAVQQSCEEKLAFAQGEVDCELISTEKGIHAAEKEDNVHNDTAAKLHLFSPISKELTSKDILEPVLAIEHALPVQFVTLNVRTEEVDICVCCVLPGADGINVLIYRVRVLENFQSDVRLTQDLHLKPDDDISVKHVESGIRFTLDGENLLVLGGFGTMNTSVRKNGVKVISLLNRESEAQLELAANATTKCLLVTGPTSFLAGGDGGQVKQWQMQPSWSHASDETALPIATYNGVPFQTITKMALVPGADHLVVGSDGGGAVAVWNTEKKHLLFSYHDTQHVFFNFHAVDVSLMGEHSDLRFGGCICLVAEVGEAPEWQKSWRMVAIENNSLFVGDKLGDRYFHHPTWYLLKERILCRRVCSASALGRYGVGGTAEGRVFLWSFSTGKRVAEMFEQGTKTNVLSVFDRILNADSALVQVATAASSAVLLTVAQDGRVILYV